MIIIAAATIRYKSRHWQVLNGKVLAQYPAGPAGKRRAQLHALNVNRPDIYALVWRTIRAADLDTRMMNMAIKAAHIIIDELLYSNGACHSQSRPGIFHTVTYSGQPKTYGCTCEAFSYCTIYIEDIGFICKHCLADHWAYLLGLDLPRQPIPFQGEPTINT